MLEFCILSSCAFSDNDKDNKSSFCELLVVALACFVLFKLDKEENDVVEDDNIEEEANEKPLSFLLLLLDDVDVVVDIVESLLSFLSNFLRSLSSLFSFLKKDIIFLCFRL